MLFHHEGGQVPVGRFQRHHVELIVGDRGAGRNVFPRADLPDVVQERAQQRAVEAVDRVDGFSLQRVVHPCRPILEIGVAAQHRCHALHRREEVHVDRVPMVRITLRPASDGGPRRQVAGKQTETVECIEHVGPRRARPEQSQEGIADLGCPRHGVRYARGLDRIQQPRSGDASAPAHPLHHPCQGLERLDGPFQGRRWSVAAIGEHAIEHRRSDVLDVRACSNSVRINPSVAVRRG